MENNKALTVLFEAINLGVDNHEDNPQLLFFIQVLLNNADMVKEIMEKYEIDPNTRLTGRNQEILSGFEKMPGTIE